VTRTRRSASEWAGWVEPIYLDSSAFVKLFVKEASSGALNLALSVAVEVVLADLTFTELASFLGRRTREGRLTIAASRAIYHKAEKLGASFRRVELTPPIHRRAERLLLTSTKVPLRALDALHLAMALDADAATLVSFDERLREAAKSQGLFIAPSLV
jgi:predicted nucleic acid-binding protein